MHRSAEKQQAPRLRWATLIAALLGLTLLVSACTNFPFASGDQRAADVADSAAEQIASHSANTPDITLLEMVAWWVPQHPMSIGAGTALVEPLAWSGESAGSQATIEIRVLVDVPGQSATTVFGPSWGPGSATRCYQLEWKQYEPARRSEIPCTDDPAPRRPVPSPRPALTAADTERVVEIVTSHESARDVELALHDAYPQNYMRIEADAVDGGVVAAVGIPAERKCILVLRDEAGEITFPAYRQISLEPGEAGCSTTLYTASPF